MMAATKQRMSTDRAVRRMQKRRDADVEDLARSAPHARLKRGTAGHADHWLAKSRRTKALRATLGAIRTEGMIEQCPEVRFVVGAYPTALALAEAEYADLVKLNGVGPKRLTKIRAYLSKNNVPCSWKVP